MDRVFNILNDNEEELDFVSFDKPYRKKKKKKLTSKNLKIEPVIKVKDDYVAPPHEYLLELPFSMLFIAPKGSGKTTTIHNLLVYYKNYFDEVFIFSPTIDIDFKWNKLIDKLKIPRENCLHRFGERKVNGIMESIKGYNKNKKNKDKLKVLFIFDDCAEIMRTHGKKRHYLNKLAFNHRHYNISHIIVSQSFKKLEPGIRSNATGIVLYNTDNLAERAKIVEELAGNIGRTQFEKLWFDCVREPFGFMYINYKQRLIYKNFDKVIGDLNQEPVYLFDKLDKISEKKKKIEQNNSKKDEKKEVEVKPENDKKE